MFASWQTPPVFWVKKLNYTVKRSYRKTVGLEVKRDCTVLVRAPYGMSGAEIDKFVTKYSGWIEEKLSAVRKRADLDERIDAREEELRLAAKERIPWLVSEYSDIMGLKPTSVKITSAKGRFGSCGAKNGLCFSWRLMAYPERAVRYVVVHELAHIAHHNHSPAFYALVEKYMPDYKERQKLLKEKE